MSGMGEPQQRMTRIAAVAIVAAVLMAASWWALTDSTSDSAVPTTATDLTTSDDGDTGRDLGPRPEVVVVGEYPHDSTYTQGLEFIDNGPDAGLLLESGGQWGESSLRVWDPTTGQVVRTHEVDDDLFAEGTTIVGDEAWQLTWQAETALRYDLETLMPTGQVSYNGEGWGLCQLGPNLVMSNGSSLLTVRDPDTFEERSTVSVTRDGEPVESLNELECVSSNDADGPDTSDLVWANIYQSTEVVAINPTTGDVIHTIDASALVPAQFVGDNDLVLNGIAYNSETGRFWLTGKRWPVIYEVELR